MSEDNMRRRYDAQKAFEEKIADAAHILAKQLSRIQDTCTHSWAYHSDPSGNNDSYYSCSYCRAESKGRPE